MADYYPTNLAGLDSWHNNFNEQAQATGATFGLGVKKKKTRFPRPSVVPSDNGIIEGGLVLTVEPHWLEPGLKDQPTAESATS